MKIFFTNRFKKSYKKLPEKMKERVKKQLRLFEENSSPPSLQNKKMKGDSNRWEIRVTRSYRMTYMKEKDGVYFMQVGTHDILDKE